MFRFVLLLCVALTVNFANALSDEQKAALKAHFETVAAQCGKDHDITEDDATKFKEKKVPSGPNAPCFLACVMKNIGVMTNEGKLQEEKIVLELAKAFFKDENDLKSVKQYLSTCSPLNDQAVGDGNKGCERALLAYKCINENALKFGFDI